MNGTKWLVLKNLLIMKHESKAKQSKVMQSKAKQSKTKQNVVPFWLYTIFQRVYDTYELR